MVAERGQTKELIEFEMYNLTIRITVTWYFFTYQDSPLVFVELGNFLDEDFVVFSFPCDDVYVCRLIGKYKIRVNLEITNLAKHLFPFVKFGP